MFKFVETVVDTAGLYNGDKFITIIDKSVKVANVNETILFLLTAGRAGQTIVIDQVTYHVRDYLVPAGTNIELLLNMGYLVASSEYEADVVIDKSSHIISKGYDFEIDKSKILTPEQLEAFWLRLASWQKMTFQMSHISKTPVYLQDVYGFVSPSEKERKDRDLMENISILNRDAKYNASAIYYKGYQFGELDAKLRNEVVSQGNSEIWVCKGLVSTI